MPPSPASPSPAVKEAAPLKGRIFRATITGTSTNGLIRVLNSDGSEPGGEGRGIWYRVGDPGIVDESRRAAPGDGFLVRLDERNQVAKISPMLPDRTLPERPAREPRMVQPSFTPTRVADPVQDAHMRTQADAARARHAARVAREAADEARAAEEDAALEQHEIAQEQRTQAKPTGKLRASKTPNMPTGTARRPAINIDGLEARRCASCRRTMLAASMLDHTGKCGPCSRS